jgi:cytochrome c oxidase subunit 2
MPVALILVLLALGSVLFHVMSPWWFSPLASNWGYMDQTIVITFWITGVVYVVILLFMAYCVLRFRHRKGVKAAYNPENKKLEWWLTIVTAVGVAAMLAPGLVVWNDFITVPKEATTIEVLGQQWMWNYRLPGKDGVLGTADTKTVSTENPLGLMPNDRHGDDDIVIVGDALHLPIGKPVKLSLRSIDVLHDYFVPQFRAKMDGVPGMTTYFWFIPTKTGTYEAMCAELCGTGHYTMRGSVVVEEEAAYQEWLKKQPTFKQVADRAAKRRDRKSDLASGEKMPAFTK